MPKRYAPKKSEQSFVIKSTFFVLLSVPLLILGILQDSLDTRNQAFEELELSENNPCIISLPNVNPYSLEVDTTVRVTVDAKLENSGISGLQITDSSGKDIYQESFEDYPLEIGTSFEFTPTKSGMIDMLGVVKKAEGGSVGCKISSPYDIKGLQAIANNSSPEFSSNPSSSSPSQDIKTDIQYEYTLTATDADSDRINYFYSFTPRADWLKAVVIDDGSNGKLTITFRGSTVTAGSYLAHVLIHDGYSKNVRSQSWVISVSPAENDIPIVKIIEPSESLRIDAGSSFKTTWEASDLNHIAKYQLFMAQNPTDENSWKSIEDSIPYNMTSYNINTNNLSSGRYNLIVKAIDNQTPSKAGIGISPEIVLSSTSGTPDTDDKDDQIFLQEAQVTNMSPSSADTITYPRVTLKGTIIASSNATIEESSIVFKVNDKDVTDSIKINRISDSEYTLIYQPEEDLGIGENKAEITFKDSNSKSATKSWNFTITSEKTEEDSSTYNIFGYSISKRTAIIIGAGLLIIVVALLAPFVISSVWKEDEHAKEEPSYLNSNLPYSTSTGLGEGMYSPIITNEEIKEKVDKVAEPIVETDTWDSYSAPTPIPEEEVVPETTTVFEQAESEKSEDTFVEPSVPEYINNTESALPDTHEEVIPNEIKEENISQYNEKTSPVIPTYTEGPVLINQNEIPTKSEEIVEKKENVVEEVSQEENISDEIANKPEEISTVNQINEESIETPMSIQPNESPLSTNENLPTTEEVKPAEPEKTTEENPNELQTDIAPVAPIQEIPETPVDIQNTPEIQEPEVPDASDLQKIFEQIPKKE